MQFRDLKKQYHIMKEDIDNAIMHVMADADFISGQAVCVLEKKLAEYVGVKHCITCGNGTDALELALLVWDVGAGDAVFVPDFTFFASGEAPARCGATPIFVDVERDTFNISPEALEQTIQRIIAEGVLTPKVIVAVDLFGQPANYQEIRKIADKYNVWILEDGAQGFGGSVSGKKACSFGDIGITSFFPAKPLGCYGDGGAIFTNNDEWAEIIRSLCVHGKGGDKYNNIRIGMNSRLDTIQAAVLDVKFKAFVQNELEQVNQVAVWYSEMLDDLVVTPRIMDGFVSSQAQYTIVCKDLGQRQRLQEELRKADIPTAVYYAKGMHEQKAFVGERSRQGEFGNTLYLKDRVLSLPIHPYLEKEQVEGIAREIEKVLL